MSAGDRAAEGRSQLSAFEAPSVLDGALLALAAVDVLLLFVVDVDADLLPGAVDRARGPVATGWTR